MTYFKQSHYEVKRKRSVKETLQQHTRQALSDHSNPRARERSSKIPEADGIHLNQLEEKVMARRIRQHLTTNQIREQQPTTTTDTQQRQH